MSASPLRPLPVNAFDYWKAHHLLNRAGFGGTPAQVGALRDLGLAKAVDLLVDFDQHDADAADSSSEAKWDATILRPETPDERRIAREAREKNDEATLGMIQKERQRREKADREQMTAMQVWWMKRLIESGRPLEEKLTLFWHGHFASGYRTVDDSWHMMMQNQMFRAHAAGNFGELVSRIIRDPAMIKYLDNDENRRARPNENLARELMELFALGEGQGYTEDDIKEGARALTGFTFKDDDFVYQQNEHDETPKTLFGRRGTWDGDDFVKMILEHREASEFVCRKLYRYFVNDAPGAQDDDGKDVVKALARELREANYELRPMLKALFKSEHFYAARNQSHVIKSPIQLIVQAIRSYRTPSRSLPALVSAADLMGQHLFHPPSVKGWDGGRSWINTSTLFVRQNLLIYLLTGLQPKVHDWEHDEARFDATHLVDELRTNAAAAGDTVSPDDLATFLLRFSLAAPPHAARRAAVRDFLAANSSAPENDRILGALCLITALPEYQVC